MGAKKGKSVEPKVEKGGSKKKAAKDDREASRKTGRYYSSDRRIKIGIVPVEW